MGSHAKYAPIPQRDEVIILDSIHSPNYNFNTGIPNSVPSSSTPSVAYAPPSIRSIPNSPPPSFHTHSSPGTPRPTPSTTASADYAELWGVAPSSVSLNGDAAPTEICAASDALNTIRALQRRVEKLEESLGRLLLEKETWLQMESGGKHKSNCCVKFTDANSDMERAIAASASNCCVRFKRSTHDRKEKEDVRKGALLLAIVFMVCVMFVGIAAVRAGKEDSG